MNKIEKYTLGVDVGSTTIKIAIFNKDLSLVYSDYKRHNANVQLVASTMLSQVYSELGNCEFQIVVTGSVGMGYADRLDFSFVQEVVSAAAYVQHTYPEVGTLIDMGGEDSKMIFFEEGKVPDIRMNGSCAGGTGTFIDQIASLLDLSLVELSELAQKAETIYPIASRCGVYSKTDVQNLVSRNVSKKDIAASVFKAVSLQLVASLAHGADILPKVLLCGGPFAFLPSLKESLLKVLQLDEQDCILPENAHIIPAMGCALLAEKETKSTSLLQLIATVRLGKMPSSDNFKDRLPALFSDGIVYKQWRTAKMGRKVLRASLSKDAVEHLFLGVDSGSTTTKIVLLNEKGALVYSDYRRNKGDSLHSFQEGLQKMLKNINPDAKIVGSAVTGYGENLLKVAFDLDHGIVETIAHFKAAQHIVPEASFVLDIGGQDMKAIFIENGSIKRIEINEACSSGCGSFIETFSNMLGFSVEEFAQMSCRAQYPCDLGTRCTVFMNSKVKQSLREGAAVEDIAAGFSYSVIKNCLYKVLKLKSIKELGDHIVVQGGTFKNPSVLRAFEIHTGKDVTISDIPELMGAYGAALYALEHRKVHCPSFEGGVSLREMADVKAYDSSLEICYGCENHCTIKTFKFQNGKSYYSGNNCEKVYSNSSEKKGKGVNMFAEKYKTLFKREDSPNLKGVKEQHKKLTIGIPRALGIYENYPFWKALFSSVGIDTVLSSPSTNKLYNKGMRSIMADNICFPAKLMHGHVINIAEKKVDRIFYPYVIYEQKEDKKAQNSFNCPIVAGYSDVIKSSIDTVSKYGIPFDAPVITFNDEELLYKSCAAYLKKLGVGKKLAHQAVGIACKAQKDYLAHLAYRAKLVLEKAREEKRMVILLAARPYHIDPMIEHKVAQSISEMGIDVITENIALSEGSDVYDELTAVSQWAYPNRVFKAANVVAKSTDNLHFVELTSFGCGPDAFILGEVEQILARRGKNLTILKIDDVNNIGSLRLRIRSLVESLLISDTPQEEHLKEKEVICTKIFGDEERKRTIIAPYFAEGYSEFLPPIFKLLGYNLVNLPTGNQSAAELGLKLANNDVCYPATIVIGSVMEALQSGDYDLDNTAVIMSQTGGQCRASNYISLLKNAMLSKGITNVPVISLALGKGMENTQPGFIIPWKKVIKITLYTMLYADCISKLYFPAVVREKTKGAALELREQYMKQSFPLIENKDYKGILKLLKRAVKDFAAITKPNLDIPKIGIVGEIYVKYNGFSNKFVLNWLCENGVEVVSPSLYNFFSQTLVDAHINKKKHIKKVAMPLFLNDAIYAYLKRQVKRFDAICSSYPYYLPFSDIFEDEKLASRIVNTAANFGEGWLIPAEISNLASHGVKNVVSLQPFGCIANHVISKGIEKRVKQLYPQMSLLFLDFDSGTSEANVFNRLHFMVENSKVQMNTPNL